MSWNEAIEAVNQPSLRLSDHALPLGVVERDAGLKRLPAEAREKLLDLRQQRDDADGALAASSARREDLRSEKDRHDHSLKRLTASYQDDGFQLIADNPQVIAQQQKVDAAREQFKRVAAHCDALAKRFGVLEGLVGRLEAFITGPAIKWEKHRGPAPTKAPRLAT
jgi:chromosome segregation ATPase